MKKSSLGGSGMFVIVGLILAYVVFNETDGVQTNSFDPVEPDWAAIAAWPDRAADAVDAVPDPNRTFTAVIFDDSGSMENEIEDAKTAVIAALDAMGPGDRLTVIALNAGQILPFTSVTDATSVLPDQLAKVRADGGTPLTLAVRVALDALTAEAANAGGFGVYRILVTTDGQADNDDALQAEIEDIARRTPVQVATIGVGIRGNHVLRRSDLAAFVAIDNVSQLAAALRDVIAEEQTFSAITSFGDG